MNSLNVKKAIITFFSSIIVLFVSTYYFNNFYSHLENILRFPKKSIGPIINALLIALLSEFINWLINNLRISIQIKFFNDNKSEIRNVFIKGHIGKVKSDPIRVQMITKIPTLAFKLLKFSKAKVCLRPNLNDYQINCDDVRFFNTDNGLEFMIANNLKNSKKEVRVKTSIVLSSWYADEQGSVEVKIIYKKGWNWIFKNLNKVVSNDLLFEANDE